LPTCSEVSRRSLHDALPISSIVVAAPVGERERWVSAAGRTTIESDGARDLCVRLAARYWDLDDPIRAKDLEDILAEQWVRLVIQDRKSTRLNSSHVAISYAV